MTVDAVEAEVRMVTSFQDNFGQVTELLCASVSLSLRWVAY